MANEPNTNVEPNNAEPQPKAEPKHEPIDYDKIQKMLNGTLEAKENTALKRYFAEQGLSEDETKEAIADYKKRKAESTPNVSDLQKELELERAKNKKASIKSMATTHAIELGVSASTIPYLLKMSGVEDLEEADEDKIVEVLKQTLEDVPALKPQKADIKGFSFGSSGEDTDTQKEAENRRRARFGLSAK